MPLPKLSPLQSRLAASLAASLTLLLLYFAFSSSHFAYAAELGSIDPEDHNHERLLERPLLDFDLKELDVEESGYQPDFIGVDRGIVGRASTTDESIPLTNNQRQRNNIPLGTTVTYVFSNASVWGNLSVPASPVLAGRNLAEDETEMQDGKENPDEDQKAVAPQELKSRDVLYRTVYITVTTCTQPAPVDPQAVSLPPPQLQVFVSPSSANRKPGPGNTPQMMIDLVGGYGFMEVNASADVFIGVHGKNDTAFKDVWNAEIAVSIDAPFHTINNDTNLILVDTDSTSAYLVANNPVEFDGDVSDSESLAKVAVPYVIFASKSNGSSIMGMENSYCGLTNKADIVPFGARPGTAPDSVKSWLRKRKDKPVPEQRISLTTLTKGTQYDAILAVAASPNATVGGGGKVFRRAELQTLNDSNCAVVTNLTLCDAVNYAVPSNPKFNITQLEAFYENYTTTYFKFFQRALAQVPCNTTSSAQYSLVANCTSCTQAYKEWFCAVSIPRCTDFGATGLHLQPRNILQPFPNGTSLQSLDQAVFNSGIQSFGMNSSRNLDIDRVLEPGPYKEILPCDDLCYNVVRNCPSKLSFNCPRPGYKGFSTSYRERFLSAKGVDQATTSPVTCNYPGTIPASNGHRWTLSYRTLTVPFLVGIGMMCI
ncbi:hypothetical protein HYFRA_00001424 [Hymenoscyphus fraxineus]|uniref:Calcium influx-promoting protein ehs1 n=1 Tax=Hymenoscyphus fraxineus TaxID=746836 RepID=A0A9N9L7J4_9HELO|nr:hypothetical protein HYFRA_00001424 [Hymenoscyphus fraxineus]